ncbi:MAG: hypothetical protein NC120_11255 [Ruminococcus sp.]|nr:hypothetical protein [Ruminococcus sp.]
MNIISRKSECLRANFKKKFEDLGDLSIAEFEELVGMKFEQYKDSRDRYYLRCMDAKDDRDLYRNYDYCTLEYYIPRKKYAFTLWWPYKNGSRYFLDSSYSLGKTDVLTFDTPLEFTDYSDPEVLGAMIIEALDRSRKIAYKVAGNPYPKKDIELLNESKLAISAPRDKHFTDEEDKGVCEVYQLYGYYPREDSEKAVAAFYIGIAAELECDMSEDNIRNAWEKQNGKAELFEVKSVEHGIFKFRAEMGNKSVHRISYLLQIDESELLDCTMEMHKPNSRKKLDEKLSGLFEEFARGCKIKDE